MHGPDAFRHKLRRRLLGIAQMRRCACANQPSGADLKAIAHCEWLAASAATLEPRLCAAVGETMADPARARRFAAIWADLPEALGTTLWPRDAGELTASMVRQSLASSTPSRRARTALAPSSPMPLAAAVAGDFTGGLAVVGPMLAVWQVAAGLRQWQQATIAVSHPATLARVEAISPPRIGRDAAPMERATVSFSATPGGAPCRTAIDLGSSVAVGDSIAVVPQAGGCEAPLVVAAIGDPAASFALAAAFAAAGFASLKAWSWLGRRSRPSPTSPRRPSAPDLGAIRG